METRPVHAFLVVMVSIDSGSELNANEDVFHSLNYEKAVCVLPSIFCT